MSGYRWGNKNSLREVKTLFNDKNLGCKHACSNAVTWFFEQEEQGIILEDDCLPSQSFFWFCENLLTRYKKNYDILIYITYIYVFWRMLSRNYGVYSFTAGYYLGVPRLYLNFSQLEIKPYELVSLQFIHRFFPVPSYDFILNFQIFTAVLCVAGVSQALCCCTRTGKAVGSWV